MATNYQYIPREDPPHIPATSYPDDLNLGQLLLLGTTPDYYKIIQDRIANIRNQVNDLNHDFHDLPDNDIQDRLMDIAFDLL